MLSVLSNSFAVQLGSFRMESINSKMVVMHIAPVFVLVVIAFVIVQLLTGGTRRIRVSQKQMSIRLSSFGKRLTFITSASIAGAALAVIFPFMATFNVLLSIVISVVTVPLVAVGLVAWFFVINTHAIIDLATPATFLRGRRSIALDCWKGIGIEQHGKSAWYGGSSPAHGVCLIPTEKAASSLGGSALTGGLGTLATFKKEAQAREFAAEVARFSGLPLVS